MKISFKNLLIGFDDILNMKGDFADREFDENEIGKAFGITLKALRASKKLSLKNLSNIIDIPDATINRYENGINIPTITQAIKISEFFEIPIEIFVLLGLEHMENPIDIAENYQKLLAAFAEARQNGSPTEIL